ncbi:MAG: orotidine-5'-phosphate decarboxylase [Candidatus Latescibacterota bacterium]
MSFLDKLQQAASGNRSLLCVGLDPVPEQVPACLRDRSDPVLAFNAAIIAATADLVCAYKPNFAFYGALGAGGWATLAATLARVPPGVPVIVDAKVGDIGNTAERYARMFLDELGADAVTVSPYMGRDAVLPFVERGDRGVFVLCLTSNPGAADFETQTLAGGAPLYEEVTRRVCQWNTAGNCGLVVGATQPEALARIRRLAPDLPFLVPGVGAQGGDVRAVVQAGCDAAGAGLVINASRSVLYASPGADFAEAARQEAMRLRDQINQYRR